MNLSRFFFVFFFLTSFSSVLFSSLLVFVHHVSHSPPFSFPFRLIFLFSWSPSPWTHFSLLPSLSLTFLNNKFPFFFESKTLQRFTFCVHALPLFVLLFIDLFICCLFSLFLFSLSMTSFWNTYLTLLHFQKLFTFLLDIFTNLYVFACSSFLSVFFLLFCVYYPVFWWHSPFLFSFLNICFSYVSLFVVLFECISPFFFFFGDSLWFESRYPFSAFFSTKILLRTLLSFQKPRFFSKLFPCFLDSTEWLDGMLSPSSCFFTSLEKIT